LDAHGALDLDVALGVDAELALGVDAELAPDEGVALVLVLVLAPVTLHLLGSWNHKRSHLPSSTDS